MENSIVEIISGRKIGILHIDGYLYYKQSGNSRRYWTCRYKGKCAARAITTGDGETLIVCKGPASSPHNHAPNIGPAEAKKLPHMKRKAVKKHSEMPPVQIIRKELREISSGKHNFKYLYFTIKLNVLIFIFLGNLNLFGK